MSQNQTEQPLSPFRERLYRIIFKADTPEGYAFDVVLIILIILSVLAVMLESVSTIQADWHNAFVVAEWIFTVFFTIEYVLRLYCVRSPRKYATSFFGIVDLLALIPSYLSFFFIGGQTFLIVRILRLFRIFRIFKLVHFMQGAEIIRAGLIASRYKISVFLIFILLLVTIMGSIMYLIEGGTNEGFTSIPISIYWAIVTLTTVGYGDISPITSLGQFISAFIMIIGYAVIAVPTGIVTAEMATQVAKAKMRRCHTCGKDEHEENAIYCSVCGHKLPKGPLEKKGKKSGVKQGKEG